MVSGFSDGFVFFSPVILTQSIKRESLYVFEDFKLALKDCSQKKKKKKGQDAFPVSLPQTGPSESKTYEVP